MTISSPPLACLWLDPRFCRSGTPNSVQPCATEVSRYTKKPFSEHSWTRSGPEPKPQRGQHPITAHFRHDIPACTHHLSLPTGKLHDLEPHNRGFDFPWTKRLPR